jgi:SpoVK/Ycf46/Vps4 family AAA+-type ATPase
MTTSNSTSSQDAALFEEWLVRYNQNPSSISTRTGLLIALQASSAPDCVLQQITLEMDSQVAQGLTVPKQEAQSDMSCAREHESDLLVEEFFCLYPDCVRDADPECNIQDDDEKEVEIEPATKNVMARSTKDEVQVVAPPQAARSNPYQQQTTNNHKVRPLSSSWEMHQPPSRGNFCYGSGQQNCVDYNHQPTASSWDAHSSANNPFQTARQFHHHLGSHENQDPDTNNNHEQMQSGSAQQQPRAGPNIPDSLKRKFQPPKRSALTEKRSSSTVNKKPVGGTATKDTSSSSATKNTSADDDELPEELQGLDKELVEKILHEIMESGEKVTFDDIAGLADAKATVQELVIWPMQRPDLFTGLRRGPNGLLLFGPPGTGKTLIGKAVAHESGATFFAISSSSLTSKWIGEGEKLVKTLFHVAAYKEPAVVFIDEIDSLLTARKADENEASRRIKTEFLVQLDGTCGNSGRVLCIGATNRPHELDDAARRRFVKRLYIPLPERSDRRILLSTLLKKNAHELTESCLDQLAEYTEGFSGADLKALCVEAAMGPLRQLGARALSIKPEQVPPISMRHFRQALKGVNPSVSQHDLKIYVDWDKTYGSKRATNYDDSEEDGGQLLNVL